MELIVMTIFPCEAASVADAEEMVNDANERYEGRTFAVAAESLSGLPHPTQVAEIAAAFGSE